VSCQQPQPGQDAQSERTNGGPVGRRCCTLLLYLLFDSFEFRFWPVELRRFELLTSCMPSSGNPSTRVCSRRSPSRRVHQGPPASRPVAVLPCCTTRCPSPHEPTDPTPSTRTACRSGESCLSRPKGAQSTWFWHAESARADATRGLRTQVTTDLGACRVLASRCARTAHTGGIHLRMSAATPDRFTSGETHRKLMTRDHRRLLPIRPTATDEVFGTRNRMMSFTRGQGKREISHGGSLRLVERRLRRPVKACFSHCGSIRSRLGLAPSKVLAPSKAKLVHSSEQKGVPFRY
jgi:hypothetical protein